VIVPIPHVFHMWVFTCVFFVRAQIDYNAVSIDNSYVRLIFIHKQEPQSRENTENVELQCFVAKCPVQYRQLWETYFCIMWENLHHCRAQD
jgi:hypothetical protein